jgi:hypothetical protein
MMNSPDRQGTETWHPIGPLPDGEGTFRPASDPRRASPAKRATGAPKSLHRQARTAHQPICAMAVIGLVTVGFLGCWFMVYVLFQWMQETVRKD